MNPQERKEQLIREFAIRKANNKETPKSINEIRKEVGILPLPTLNEGEQLEETLEDRLFQLECEVSMQRDLIIQLIQELNKQGISVSTKIKYLEGD